MEQTSALDSSESISVGGSSVPLLDLEKYSKNVDVCRDARNGGPKSHHFVLSGRVDRLAPAMNRQP
eukprot:1737849-Pyramimonas_sp.AAC.1